jgi:protein TonB
MARSDPKLGGFGVARILLLSRRESETRFAGAIMFDAVLENSGPRRPIGRGALASLAVHGGLLGIALYLSAHSHSDKPRLERAVTFFNPPAPPPPPPPPPGGGQRSHAKVEPKKVIKKPDTVVQTEKPVETPEPSKPDPEPAGQPGGVVGGVLGGKVGGVVGGTVGGVLGNELKSTSSVLPFGPGMNRPSLLNQTAPIYTREAKAAQVSGLILVKCVINVSGSLSGCHIIKGLPFMDQAVLTALSTWKYTPITYQGHAVSVEYVIPVRLVAP